MSSPMPERKHSKAVEWQLEAIAYPIILQHVGQAASSLFVSRTDRLPVPKN